MTETRLKPVEDKLKKLQIKVAGQKRKKTNLTQMISGLELNGTDPVPIQNELKDLENLIKIFNKDIKHKEAQNKF